MKKKKKLLDKTLNHTSKFRTKNWVEINDDARGTYNKDSQIKFKTSVLKTSLCDNSDAYILVTETVTIDGAGADDAAKRLDERNKRVILRNCAPFTDCLSKINNAKIHHAKDLDVVMPI